MTPQLGRVSAGILGQVGGSAAAGHGGVALTDPTLSSY